MFYLLCTAREAKQLEHNDNFGSVQIRADVFTVFKTTLSDIVT